MSVVVCGLSALTVAQLFYFWRSYHVRQVGRDRKLRERVAYMLWVMAHGAVET